ncbi:MAG TPA: AMP-binding protein, partial [Rhodopila sp.]|nr:AMP-binding protein [Rhodopila sp.]
TDPEDRTIGDVMNYTSGTTGNPKGVFRRLSGLSPEEAALGQSGILFLFNIQPQDENVHIVGSPLYHTAVMRFSGASIHLGHTIVVMDKWLPEEMLRLIQEYKVTTSHMVPTQFHRLLALPQDVRDRYDLTSLRHMIHAAAPCPVDVKHQMIAWWGPILHEYYGATEGNGMTRINAAQWLAHPGSVGQATVGVLHICNETGAELPTGEAGLVYFEREEMPFAYHKDPERTRAAQHPIHLHWSTLGDIGYLDDDGFLYLTDRKAFMIISGGVNIYPREIEDVLIQHPAVRDVAVFGIPDAEMGEQVKAVVEPMADAGPSDALAQALIEHARARLAHYKVPKSVDFMDELPRLPTGKLYKQALRAAYAGRTG